MLGIFGSMDMAAQSLSVQQEAMAVSGQNLANVNNPAYAREQLNVQASTALQTPVGQEGTGVEAVSITEVRDALLDAQIQSEGSTSGSLTAQQNALQEAQAYLNEQLTNTSSSGSTASSPDGLTSDLSNLFTAFQALSTDASSVPDRQAAVQAAQQLAQQFNSVSSGLSTVQANLNSSIASDVTSSNQDLSDIASLNQQIMIAQASGGTANDLVDQREKDIEDLAGKVGSTATAQADGSVTITVAGVTLVSGANQLDSMQTYNSFNGNLMVRAAGTGITMNITGGTVEGSITARDGSLNSLQTSLNTLASQVITQVNNIYSTGYDLYGHTGAALFSGVDANTITVNSAVVNDPNAFQAGAVGGNVGDNTVVLALAKLGGQTSAALGDQTFSGYYAGAVGDLGSALSSVNDQSANSAAVTQMLTNQRSSESGVSTDEEMTNIVQFQKAYQASAEFISTLNEMLYDIVNMKTE